MNSNSGKKGVASWVWWLLGLVVIVLIVIGRCGGVFIGKKVDLEKYHQDAGISTQEVIVLKPGETISLEINENEWSPWIDASKVYSYPHTSDYGIKQLFSNGDSLTVKLGERIKLLPKNKGYSIYRLKTPLGIGNQIAIIQASNEPINKELYK